MGFLSAEQLLAIPDAPEEVVHLESLGGSIKIKTFSKAVQDKIRDEARQPDESLDRALLDKGMLFHAIVEPKLTRKQIDQLYEKLPWRLMDTILERFYILSGMTPEGLTSERAVKEAEAKFRS